MIKLLFWTSLARCLELQIDPPPFEMASERAKLNIGARMTNKGDERRDGRTGKRGLAGGIEK